MESLTCMTRIDNAVRNDDNAMMKITMEADRAECVETKLSLNLADPHDGALLV
jgi:hypothetical protein